MKTNRLIILFTILMTALQGYSQDVQYSQFYSAPLYLNPALAGTGDQHRFVANFRDQWSAIPGAFVSYSVSYDLNIPEANSGIGFFANRDQAGSGSLSTSNIGGVYAYDLKINRKLAFRPAIGVGFGFRSVDMSKLRFGDQLLTGNNISIQSNTARESVSYADISAGGLLYSNDMWVGYSVFHLNRPNNSLMGEENIIDAFHSVHAGYRFTLKKSVKRVVTQSVTLTANYKSQGQWDQFDIGAYFYTNPMVFGVWYRGIPGLKSYRPGYANNDAVVILAGVHYKSFKFAYSYDITISKVYANTGGSHEISLIYEYINPRKKRKRRRVKLACPKF